MSTRPSTDGGTGGSTGGSAAARLWRRHRSLATITALVLALLLVVTLLGGRSTRHGGDLDPDNPGPGGAEAAARVLSRHGVPVSVVRRAAALDRARVDRRTTVVVTSSQALGRRTARRLRDRLADAGAVVLAAPDGTLRRALRLQVASEEVRSGRRVRAGCNDPLLSGLTLEVPPSEGYRLDGAAGAACFRGAGARPGAYVLRLDAAATADLAPAVDRPRTYLLAAAALLTNQRLTRADNAAVALRLLGQRRRVLWYVPDTRDVRPGDVGSLAAQLPAGLVPGLWLSAAAVVATALWRGRRLGPLVVEPLPVAVKAVESTQGRGRLYRHVRDRTHAATVLREATTRRLSVRLRLPAATGAADVATAVAAATGADHRSVRELLVPGPVPDDRALTRLAAGLAALEKETSRP